MQKYYPELLNYPEEEEPEPTPLSKPDDPEFALIHPEVEMVDDQSGQEKEQEEDEEEDHPMEIELPEWLR